jgi:hypothetical protein
MLPTGVGAAAKAIYMEAAECAAETAAARSKVVVEARMTAPVLQAQSAESE